MVTSRHPASYSSPGRRISTQYVLSVGIALRLCSDTLLEGPVFTRGPPDRDPPHTTPRLETSARKKWIRRLPRYVKKSKSISSNSSTATTDSVNSLIEILALFGRRIAPTILVELHEDPGSTSPISPQEQENSLSVPPISPQEGPVGTPPTILQEDHTDVSPIASQGDSAVTIPVTAQHPRISPMPGAYDVDW